MPGGQEPLAQFVYRDESGSRLTPRVPNEIGEPGSWFDTRTSTPTGANKDTALRLTRAGKVTVFYWVEGPFGDAISADADRAALARVCGEVCRQLRAMGR